MTQVWETDRTGLAAALVVNGFQLLELVCRPAPKLPGGHACYFVFAWRQGIEQNESLFFAGELLVDPREYARTYADVRRQMREALAQQMERRAVAG